jgi:hypothetical protein
MPEKVLMPLSKSSSENNSKPLPPSMRHEFETKFGQDFSEVRIHQNHQATLLGAEVFTKGNDICFAPGKYQPFTETGNALIGHEVAHIVQQSGQPNNKIPQGMIAVDNAQNNE